MKQKLKNSIDKKIEELRKLAKSTDSIMLCMFIENDVNNRSHLVAYGNGIKIKSLIINSLKQNSDLMNVMKAVRDEAFPSTLPGSIQEALNSGDGVYRP